MTVLGDLRGAEPVLRSGARPGDVVAVVGRLGWAAAGLAVLSRGFRSPAAAVGAYRVPEPPLPAGIVAAQSGATSMIDVSDGLLADLGHIAHASGVAINVVTVGAAGEPAAGRGRLRARPEPPGMGADRRRRPRAGRDLPARRALPPGWTAIGVVGAPGSGVSVDGAAWESAGGWDHFG